MPELNPLGYLNKTINLPLVGAVGLGTAAVVGLIIYFVVLKKPKQTTTTKVY
jgi:hypothetical protein